MPVGFLVPKRNAKVGIIGIRNKCDPENNSRSHLLLDNNLKD
jgi:hypothetical protein